MNQPKRSLRTISTKQAVLKLCTDIDSNTEFFRVFYCANNDEILSIHTHFLEQKAECSIKDIFVPALYLGAKKIWIITSKSKVETMSLEQKLQEVSVLFEMTLYFIRLNN